MPLLPLFPLDLVLFPGSPLPLHIFEPRYKEMIAECRANQAEFGIVRAVENGIAQIGCTAEIVTITKEYPDGKLDLIAAGRRRFEVMELNQDRSFLQAEVLFVPDAPGSSLEPDRTRAVESHRRILELAGAVQDLSGADESTLSFYLAASIPLDLDFKQKLLTIRSERERMQFLASSLETIFPTLRRSAQARERAGGNGHVR
ncbi:MAG TPA: LON peptidase substrate-binding domain-containing protein [Verrucomicrobiae bacterium]|nr:LON peptidase substrate-binding domain-containing protein [Verrucomicrobiae bacterium]